MPKREEAGILEAGILEAERQQNKIKALCLSCPDANHSFCYDIFIWQLRLNTKYVSTYSPAFLKRPQKFEKIPACFDTTE